MASFNLSPKSRCKSGQPYHIRLSIRVSTCRWRHTPFVSRRHSRSRRVPCEHNRYGLVTQALWGSSSIDDAGDSQRLSSSSSSSSSRRKALFELVDRLTPSRDVSDFDVPAPVLAAMRQTVTNLLGSLPPQFFKISISTCSENLAQLMFSVLMTGFMFCNAHYRLELSKSLTRAGAHGESGGNGAGLGRGRKSGSSSMSESLVGSLSGSMDLDEEWGGGTSNVGLAPGSQKLGIEGSVLRWHHEDGVQRTAALDYIHQLEEEVTALRRRLRAAERCGESGSLENNVPDGNELLDYLRTLSADQVAELTDCASPDVLESMNALVQRLIGDDYGAGIWGPSRKSECTAVELAQLLYWLMAVGHYLRVEENKLTLTASLESPSNGGMFYGPNDGEDGPEAAGWVPRLPPGR